ncbi:DUF5701 family protein [Bifidobacterium bombi]|uniref:Uncharacterized protein n=1 Tax=Bifidobacterium bombi DSM 19703 TaxID=1341695 RepID=A0A086BPM9_9BIFI|nr:DUF5701 family protein [Bifidobacterium bombi]KFF31893.1 hypothetical protein BBOMB_1303 [Bifidobacterium bombi DSM 19703]
MSKASVEVQRQLDRIVALGYPDVADMSAEAFRALARPLIHALEGCSDEEIAGWSGADVNGAGSRATSLDILEESGELAVRRATDDQRAPVISPDHRDPSVDILLVPTRELVAPDSLIARTSINRMAGFTTMPPRDVASFLQQPGFNPPEGPFYLVIAPHTGTCYVNREPDVARKLIESDERSPLTLEEGLAIATQHPDWLVCKNGFNLLGSRSSDGRYPSIWMSQNSPRLGSVWPTSRHTWLGNAYCLARRGVSLFR